MAETMHGLAAGFTAEGTFTQDNLFAGETPVPVTQVETLLSGQSVVRGALLGKDGDGKFLLSLAAAVDGSEVPIAVALETVDATAGDTKIAVAYTGVFNIAALTIGTGHTAASVSDALQARQIYLRNNLGVS